MGVASSSCSGSVSCEPMLCPALGGAEQYLCRVRDHRSDGEQLARDWASTHEVAVLLTIKNLARHRDLGLGWAEWARSAFNPVQNYEWRRSPPFSTGSEPDRAQSDPQYKRLPDLAWALSVCRGSRPSLAHLSLRRALHRGPPPPCRGLPCGSSLATTLHFSRTPSATPGGSGVWSRLAVAHRLPPCP